MASRDLPSMAPIASPPTVAPERTLTALIVVPTLQAGAADTGAVDLVRILATAGHRPIVLSRGGRLASKVTAAGGEFIYADVASKNPLVMMRNALRFARIVCERSAATSFTRMAARRPGAPSRGTR